MKKLALLFGFLLTTLAVHAQTINVHKKSGEVIAYPLDDIDFLDFSEEVSPVGPPESVEAVDLGLPSGTKWANMNFGATKPEEYGGYYAYGELEEKKVYSEETWNWDDLYVNGRILSNIAFTKFDVVQAKWGGTWHLPTYQQIRELVDNCNQKWTEENGVKGYRLTSMYNNKSIFFPAAGYKEFASLKQEGKELRYRLGEYHGGGCFGTYYTVYGTQAFGCESLGFDVYFGGAVRAVKD